MKDNKTIKIIILVLALVSLIGTVMVYESLPDMIPRHWNIKGEVDRYGAKSGIFFTAALPLLLYGLFIVMPKIDPKRESYNKHGKAYGVVRLATVVFLIIVHWITILTALGHEISINGIIKILVGLLFVVLGNYMGQIRHNYFFGIRTPWTLANEEVWRKTHRMGGYCFIISGLLMMATFLFSNSISAGVLIAAIVISAVIPMAYSYFEYAKIKQNK